MMQKLERQLNRALSASGSCPRARVQNQPQEQDSLAVESAHGATHQSDILTPVQYILIHGEVVQCS